ncbi:hypothetical protein DFQ28_008025 [Apophysomyces sp. BC1034]|nr:hypothetical protein DFQ30_010163 [Apophysomyces sp. BC1015]KAG0186337.1 hypothetical protein DFQ28_008025 [Apophysomyces sp. BC1034]
MPPGMRSRKQRSGKIYYYLDLGGKPRHELPLGCDYIAALGQYSTLMKERIVNALCTFVDVAQRYIAEEIPCKARSTQETNSSDMRYLLKFFGDPPAPLDQIRPLHINQFLDWMKDKPTTANRCKRLFSHIWNKARAWGYTDLPNPTAGIRGHALDKREVYIDDELNAIVRAHGSPTLQDAMDLLYFCGQRPGDAMRLTEHNIVSGELVIRQSKTKAALRIQIAGELDTLLRRIRERKAKFKIVSTYLLVNERGTRLTKGALRHHFNRARAAAKAARPDLAERIEKFWLYDLRAKAADDVADMKGEQAAADLLGHTDVRTTKRHYLRRGKRVAPAR